MIFDKVFKVDKVLKVDKVFMGLLLLCGGGLSLFLLETGGCCGAVDFCYKALEDFAGAEFYEFGGSVGYHVFDGLCPAYGCGELCDEVGFDFGGVGVGTCVNVLVDGAYGCLDVGCLDGFGEFGTCGLHAG